MKRLYTTDELPKYCQECQYFREHAEQTCGLCNDSWQHYRIEGDEPWDDEQVIDCPLCSLREHDIEVTKQVCKDFTNYILNKTKKPRQ